MIQTINQLLKLQELDTALDTIEKKKGFLPKELAKLEAEIQALEKDIENAKIQIDEQKQAILDHKAASKKSEKLIERYKKQQLDVVNNAQEYDAITKEIDMQELEILLAKKGIKSSYVNIATHNEQLSQTQSQIEEKQKDVNIKKEALSKIDNKNKDQINKIQEARKTLIQKIKDTTQLNNYQKMREKNSLVVAKVVKEACDGCFIIVSAQQQIEINKYKKAIICENCGRILAKVIKQQEENKLPTEKHKATKNK